ncbi:MAG: M20/M25/M40 family metallo-hydrolase [Clostridia bacterium]|nr:M20/M25/M40 family metallo-hydrolase [Clostridia bacterium]
MSDWSSVAKDCAHRLSRLLRFDTSNPPGNELACLADLAETLREAGIETQLFESAPGRGNLLAEIPANADDALPSSEALLLMGHVDVVPAEAELWTHPPFAGDIADGCVWGRGALDMKHLVAMWTELALLIRRRGVRLRRPIKLMFNADEEAGGEYGAGWMVRHHLDRIRAAVALNEGGGEGLELGGVTYFTYQPAEKAPCAFDLIARGRPGHGSVPTDDNAVAWLSRALVALSETETPLRVTEPVRAFVEGLAAGQPEPYRSVLLGTLDPESHAASLAAIPDAYQRATLHALLHDTITPTMLEAGSRVNVIPSTARATCDCRIVPGQTPEGIAAWVREILASRGLLDHVEVRFRRAATPVASPVEAPIVDSMRRALQRHAPGSRLVPTMLTGGTDGSWLRPAGIPTYGFAPLLPGEAHETVHGIDERIRIASLEFGLKVLWDVILDYCA